MKHTFLIEIDISGNIGKEETVDWLRNKLENQSIYYERNESKIQTGVVYNIDIKSVEDFPIFN